MLALGLFASTALCTSSFAADLAASDTPAEAVVEATWSGFYAGLEAGYAFADQAEYDFQDDFLNFVLGDGFDVLGNDLECLLGGAYVGFNHQSGNIVFGLEGSFAAADINGSESGDIPLFGPFGFTAETETDINWLGTATARVGLLVSDNFLIFAKGGAAFAEIESSGTIDGFVSGNWVSIDADETALGFTVGVGGEVMFAQNWSAKLEYNYVRFDDVDFSGDVALFGGAIPLGEYDYSADVDLHLVKAGIAYHF
jgi:outer membrane immunogenic protein